MKKKREREREREIPKHVEIAMFLRQKIAHFSNSVAPHSFDSWKDRERERERERGFENGEMAKIRAISKKKSASLSENG